MTLAFLKKKLSLSGVKTITQDLQVLREAPGVKVTFSGTYP
jgi:hypothetical protein